MNRSIVGGDLDLRFAGIICGDCYRRGRRAFAGNLDPGCGRFVCRIRRDAFLAGDPGWQFGGHPRRSSGFAIGLWGGRRIETGSEIKERRRQNYARARFRRKMGRRGNLLFALANHAAGPWLNLTSGMTKYPWRRFFIWDVLGETLWVVLYVSLGKLFSGSVQALADVLGNLVWVLVGLIAAAFLLWWIVKSFREAGDQGLRKRAA